MIEKKTKKLSQPYLPPCASACQLGSIRPCVQLAPAASGHNGFADSNMVQPHSYCAHDVGECRREHQKAQKRGSRSRLTLHTHAFANPATRCISSGYSIACGSLVLHGRASRGAIRTRRPGRAVTPVSLPSRSEFPEYLTRLAPARLRCCCLAESCSLSRQGAVACLLASVKT